MANQSHAAFVGGQRSDHNVDNENELKIPGLNKIESLKCKWAVCFNPFVTDLVYCIFHVLKTDQNNVVVTLT